MTEQDDQNQLFKIKTSLDSAGIFYEILTHAVAIGTAEEGVENGVGHLAEMAPTLILKTEKGFLAAIIPGNRRLSYKKVKKVLGLKNVSMANPELVLQVSGAEIGSVSLINPAIPTIIDEHLRAMPFVFGGCGIARHTLKIGPEDLIRVTDAKVFDFTELKEESSD